MHRVPSWSPAEFHLEGASSCCFAEMKGGGGRQLEGQVLVWLGEWASTALLHPFADEK